MPVTAGAVPGVTSDLRRVRWDPGRFRSGRWFLLAEGVLVAAFGAAGLVSAALHPHAGPTGTPVLGLTSTPTHSAILLVLGLLAVAAVLHRRAAVTVTALSAVAYTMLLFVGSVATARTKPTPLGFHAADIVLHGVLAVVNLALLMWLIPDELGDEAWVPRRRRGRDGQQSPASHGPTEPAAASAGAAQATQPDRPPPAAATESAQDPEADHDSPPGGMEREQPSAHAPIEPSAERVENSAQPRQSTARATGARGVTLVALAVLTAAIGIAVWARRR